MNANLFCKEHNAPQPLDSVKKMASPREPLYGNLSFRNAATSHIVGTPEKLSDAASSVAAAYGTRDAENNLAVAALERHAADRSRVALVWTGLNRERETWTFFELDRYANRIANTLSSLGVAHGDRVFTLLGRTPALYATLAGGLKLGAAVGVLFTDFGPEAIRQRLEDAGARVVVTDAANMRKLITVCPQLPNLAHILVVNSNALTDIDASISANGVQQHDFDLTIARHAPRFDSVAVAPDDTCFFVYTSGTTGLPKGVVHRHALGERLAATAREVLALDAADLYWCTADPGWITGLCYGVFAPWLLGLPTFAYEGEFDVGVWLDLIEANQITCLYTTPTLLRLFRRAGEESVRGRDFALRRIYSVGEPLNPEVIAWVEAAFGAPVYDNYWQTETGSHIIANRPSVAVRRGSMGTAVTGARVAIIDERGAEVANGIVGDIALRPSLPSLFKGYWNFPEATRACFRAGWYITRDRGRKDEDGYFWFVARDDDVITCQAQRVGPFEVESALLTHAGVAEAAVIGVPNMLTTERVKAFVVLQGDCQPSRETAEALAAHVQAQLSPLACPREIEFVAELPKTRSGKIQRARLRQQGEKARESKDEAAAKSYLLG